MPTQQETQGALVAASIMQKLTEKIPDLAPLFLGVPELRPLFLKLLPPPAGQSLSTANFANELHKTQWWKSTPEQARLWMATSVSDPAQANLQRQNTLQDYYRIAAQEGVSISFQAMGMLVEAGLREGWDENKIRDSILSLTHGDDKLTGNLDAAATQLQGIAADWGIPYSEKAAFDQAKKLRGGRLTLEGFEEQMRGHAKAMYPAWAEQIDSGTSIKDISEPYRQLASSLLEQPDTQFDLRDNKWRRLLQQKDEKGRWNPMTLADAQNELMSDASYGYDKTKQARQGALEMVNSIGQAFGRVQ